MRATSWLPIIIVGMLVGLTVWLNQLVQHPAQRADGAARHDPDAVVERFNARKYGPDGRVLYILIAKKMVHYPDDDSALFDDVNIQAFEPGQPKVTVTADRGRVERADDQVWIEGNVVVVRDADEKMERSRLTTDRMLVLPDAGIVRTPGDVQMQTASGHATGTGMELDNKTRVLTLDKVHATYMPAKP